MDGVLYQNLAYKMDNLGREPNSIKKDNLGLRNGWFTCLPPDVTCPHLSYVLYLLLLEFKTLHYSCYLLIR